MRTQQGFTLIELMITVAIIAILSAIAIPAYSEYVMRARITEATNALSDQRLKMERYFQDHRRYDDPTGPACTPNTVAPPPAATAHFLYTCPVVAPNAYIVLATGQGSMSGFKFQIDEADTHSTTGVPAGWVTSVSCWVQRKDGSC